MLLENERVFKKIQGKVDWRTVNLFEEQKERIKLALSVEEESREWARLTDESAFYQGNRNLTNIPPEEGIDYPLKFKIGEGNSVRQAGEAEKFNSKVSKSMGELENRRNAVLTAVPLS